jgi:hypothetical protein
MAHRILYTDSTSVTGRALKGILGISGGTQGTEERPDTLIRWGSAIGVPKRPRQGAINGKAAVARASNKLDTLDILLREGVRIPQIFRAGEVTRNAPFPLLARKTRGQGGKDIKLVMQFADVERAGNPDFFSEYIPTFREFRVHVFQGEVLKINEKLLTKVEDFKVPWIRNLDNGYTFRQVKDLRGFVRDRVEARAVDAVDALELDFGAVDVILGDDGEVYVLEVNTGPGLADASLEVYARKFAEILEIPEERLNWPPEMREAGIIPERRQNRDRRRNPGRREDPDPNELDRML